MGNSLDSGSYGGIEMHMSYEAIEVERARLFELALAMKMPEIRRAGARIADYLQKYGGQVDHATRAKLELRGQTAIEIFNAMRDGQLKYSGARRLRHKQILADTGEALVRAFTGLSRVEIPLRKGY